MSNENFDQLESWPIDLQEQFICHCFAIYLFEGIFIVLLLNVKKHWKVKVTNFESNSGGVNLKFWDDDCKHAASMPVSTFFTLIVSIYFFFFLRKPNVLVIFRWAMGKINTIQHALLLFIQLIQTKVQW